MQNVSNLFKNIFQHKMAIYNNARKEAIITLHQPNIHHRKIHNNEESGCPHGGTIPCSQQDIPPPSCEGTSQLSTKGLDRE